MKYQTEYQRNYPKRAPIKASDLSAEERKLSEVPIKRSSPSRRRRRSLPLSSDRNNNNTDFAVIGPNDKFSQSRLYRLKQPIKDHPRVAKSQEYAILGKNEKLQDNVIYPLRKPVLSDSPRVVVRQRRKKENHSCGIQTELTKAASVSFDPRHRRETGSNRRRFNPQSEYRTQYVGKQPVGDSVNDQTRIEDSKLRDRRSNAKSSSPEKTSVAVNTPARVEIDVDRNKRQANRVITSSKKKFRPRRDETSEYRARYKPIVYPKQPKIRKAFEAEQVDERKRKEIATAERAHSDDEGLGKNVDFGNEFREKNQHGKLRRWKSEYQSTYKPFERFDYKNGKWYKDSAADEASFNPNRFWYKELMSTRRRADEFRANAEFDHFNRDHTLQLQTGFAGNKTNQAWDTGDDDSSDSVISIDRDLERERIEGERRREKDARRNEDERIHYEKYHKPKQVEKPSTTETDQVAQTDHQVDRVIYVDEPPPKQPSAATKAFVRNLGSSSMQQHMSWGSESLYSQRTNSDIDFQSLTARDLHRKHYANDNSSNQTNVIRKASSKKQESRGTGTHSPLPSEPQHKNNNYISPKINERTTQNEVNTTAATRLATSYPETRNATGRPSYDTQAYDKRPPIQHHTSTNDYCSYPASRFKDEVTEYYYGSDDNRPQQPYATASKSSLQNHYQTRDERYGQTYKKDDDVLSARSLSSSSNLALQTLERAEQNRNKYWGDRSATSPFSPKKPFSAKN